MGSKKGDGFVAFRNLRTTFPPRLELFKGRGKTSRLISKEFLLDKATRFSWLNCVLRGDEAVYWVSIGQQWLVIGVTESYEAVPVTGSV